MIIDAFISDLEGKNFIKRQITGPAAEADKLAKKIANELLQAGGREILESLIEWTWIETPLSANPNNQKNWL